MFSIESIRRLARKSESITFCYRKLSSFLRTRRRRRLLKQSPDGAFLACTGEKIFCDFNDPNFYWYDGDSESLVFEKGVLIELLKASKGDVYIDVGAHYGFFSACLISYLSGTDTTVVSIEPDQAVADCLDKTLSQFDALAFPSVVPLRCAVGSENTTMTAYKSDSLACLHTYDTDDTAYFKTTVEVRSLDSIVETLAPSKKVAFIKIDVDGSEPEVLKGYKKIFTEHKPIVFIEFAPWCLEGAGKDSRAFFAEINDAYDFVYWPSFQLGETKRVGIDDYDRIRDITGECVTNLILSHGELSL